MCRSPGFFSIRRNLNSLGNVFQPLQDIVNLDFSGELLYKSLIKFVLDTFADDKNSFPKTGSDGIENGIINKGFTRGTNLIDLLPAAIAAAYSCCKD